MNKVGKVRQRKFHFKNQTPADPAVHSLRDWPMENRGFYAGFRQWLIDTGYSDSAAALYGVAARQALGFLNKLYWTIDPEVDIEQTWQHFQSRAISPGTLTDYHKGLQKLVEYLLLRLNKPRRTEPVRWDYYLDTLPGWLQDEVRAFVLHCSRHWKPHQQHRLTLTTLGNMTASLRWLQAHSPLTQLADLAPERWYKYLDYRLEQGINTKTLNHDLKSLQSLLHFSQERGHAVCQRMLKVERLSQVRTLPRDLPAEQLSRLQQAILDEITPFLPKWRQRMGKMDLAWFLLMLHSGLRTCEVRLMQLSDIDWEAQRMRIEQSKGLKDRIAYLSQATLTALKAYLDVRGPAEALPDSLFVFRHKPLSAFDCGQRLHTYGKHCGVYATPHMLRHSCATLLLNCGAPVLSVQTILGHHWVDTTLGYARLYDGTVAADYYSAMTQVEQRLALPEDRLAAPLSIGQLLAMLDALRSGALTPKQCEIVRQLRVGILLLAGEEGVLKDVKVLDPGN